MGYSDRFPASFSSLLFSNALCYHWLKDELFVMPYQGIINMLVTGILPYTAVLLSAVKSSYFHVLHGYYCAVKAGQEGCVRNSSILTALYCCCVGRKITTAWGTP